MWPWEHLAVGYLLYSAYARLAYRRPPSHADAAALAAATQFPDLVDKPLAWGLGVLPSGLSLAHSLLFAVPVCSAVVAAARRAGYRGVGPAFCIGYGSHLAADALYNVLVVAGLEVGFLLWPLVPSPPTVATGLLTQTGYLFANFLEFLASPRGQAYLVMEGLLLASAAGLWMLDRYPGLGLVRRGARGVAGLADRR